MAITRSAPNKILLAGGPDPMIINDLACSEAITPGMLVERFNSGGVIRYRKSTRTGLKNNSYALDMPMQNKGISDASAANDLIEVVDARQGDVVYPMVASGAVITAGTRLTDAGNGYLKAVGGGDDHCAEALENVTATADGTHIRVEVV
jgi:hypothetical protein